MNKQRKVEQFIEEKLAHGATQKAFDEIARYLLCSCELMVGEKPYRLTEIEFYCHEINKTSCWRDGDKGPHAEPEIIYAFRYHKTAAKKFQAEMGHFYLHGSGIDFTFGNPTVRWGGILLRGIAQMFDEQTEIEGPWNVRKEVLGALKEQGKEIEKKILDGNIYLVPSSARNHPLFQGPRWNIWDKRKLLRYTTTLNRANPKNNGLLPCPSANVNKDLK